MKDPRNTTNSSAFLSSFGIVYFVEQDTTRELACCGDMQPRPQCFSFSFSFPALPTFKKKALGTRLGDMYRGHVFFRIISNVLTNCPGYNIMGINQYLHYVYQISPLPCRHASPMHALGRIFPPLGVPSVRRPKRKLLAES